MKLRDCEIVVDQVAKFFDTLYVYGWFYSPRHTLRGAEVKGIPKNLQLSSVGVRHEGVEPQLGPSKGFRIQALLRDGWKEDFELLMTTSNGSKHLIKLSSLRKERLGMYPSRQFAADFWNLMRNHPGAKVLDIGGRNRSGTDYSAQFPNLEYIVLDVIPGKNVDIVCDAHEMSKALMPESFDYIVSYSVFEHLLMPWKVAIEINRLLKPGGKTFITSHQTVGLHDAPWDFWRFSHHSWDAIFNIKSGFRILDRVQDHEQFIIPFIIREGKLDAECSAGYEASFVIAEKIGDPTVSWDVSLPEIISTTYIRDS